MKRTTIGVTLSLVLIIGATVLIVLELQKDTPAGRAGISYYSDDDGATYFSDSIFKFPPFDHNGRTAVRAVVYSCDKGNFVGFLQRYTPESLKLLNDSYNKSKQNGQSTDVVEKMMSSRDITTSGSEIKLPGAQNKWRPAPAFNPKEVKSPDGSFASMATP